MKLLFFLLRVSRGMVVLAVVFGLLSGASSAGLLALIGAALAKDKYPLATLVWGFVALCLVTPVARFASDLLLCRLGYDAVFDMRMRLSRQVLASPLRRLEEIGSHRILATLTEDISAIINALLLIPLFCINVAVIAGCLVYLCWLSPSAFGLVAAFMLLGVGAFRLAVGRGMRFQKRGREETDTLFEHFRALTGGTKELKLHRRRREAFVSDVLRTTAASLRRHNFTAMLHFIAASSFGQVLFFVFIGTLLFVFPAVGQVSTETATAFIITVLYMMNPLDNLMNTFSNLSRAGVSLRKVEALGLSLAPPREADGAHTPEAPAPAFESLELSGVTHSYHREKENSSFVLGPLDLTFRRGEVAFVIGGNGSGKTTFAKLLTGLYTPEAGEVRINGRPVTDETRDDFRQHFSVVFSDFYLFENLLGVEHPELDASAAGYLAQLQLDHKVKVADGRLSTTELSQGQRKRLALLVAYLEDRPVYVFDEWAADQDPLFKEVFYLQLLPMLKARGKTVVVISHDDRYFGVADRLVKLENGRLEYDSLAPYAHAEPAGLSAG
ncbi:MAG TPA: cyclic peptide export ABC transporter [Pyrinomonadaceae bacterium]|nr:cyclic peptide export ABC transporter [Pyrinomonadaceae bacterium]